MIRLVIAVGVGFVVSAGLIHLLLSSPRVVRRMVSTPVTHRWHTTPTPSFAGVPMFIAFAVAVLLVGGLADPIVLAVLLAAGITCVTGLVDDLADISPRAKLSGQLAGAVTVAVMANGGVPSPLLFSLVVVPWIVLVSNSVNLMDNMDGLSGSSTATSLLIVLALAVTSGQHGLALVAAAVVGAVGGFLLFNISPARVFMGDAGSLWLGLVLAATVSLVEVSPAWLAPVAAVTIVAVPLLDTGTVIVSRLRNGSSILRGGRDHLSHRLVKLGLSDGQAVALLTVATAVSGCAGALIATSTGAVMPVATVLWVSLLGLAGALLRVPVYQEER